MKNSQIRYIQVGTEVQLDDGQYLLLEAFGGNYKFLNLTTGEHHLIFHTDLFSRLAEIPTLDLERAVPVRNDVEMTKDMTFLAAHLQEVIDGSPVTPGGPIRDEYDPAKQPSQHKRLETKADELTSVGLEGYSFSSLKRKLSKYRKLGVLGLADLRGGRNELPLARLDNRIKDTLAVVMARETNRSTGTLTRLHEDLDAELLRRYPGEQLRAPHINSLRRYVQTLDRGRHTLGSAKTRQSKASAPDKMQDPRPALLPGVELQIDATQLDIFVRIDGKPTRPWVVTLIDKATRCVVAFTITARPKSVDNGYLLVQALVPRPLRPFSEYFAEFEYPDMPWAELLDDDVRANLDTTRPFIVPTGRILTDNGSDFVSATFRKAMEALGMSPTEAQIAKGSDKGHVERLFGTVNTGLLQHYPGYCGSSIDRRGVDPAKDKGLLDVYTLIELFDRWLNVYHHLPHEGLRDPVHPHIRHSPASIYAAMFDVTGFVPMPMGPDTYIKMLPEATRTIQADGIEFGGRQYDSPRLNPWRLMKTPKGKAMKHTVKWDPHNPRAIWVREPETKEWIQCRWMDRDAFIKPHAKQIREDGLEWLEAFKQVSPPTARQLLAAKRAEQKAEKKVAAERELALHNRHNAGFNLTEITPSKDAAKNVVTGPSGAQTDEDEEILPYEANNV
jgi:transposase InsO family protein